MKIILLALLLIALIISLPLAIDHYSRINIHNFVANDMDGKEVKFDSFEGTVLLIVNTATECAYTEQLLGLQALYEKYRDRGFIIISFPSDSFKQEPRDTRQVILFCKQNYLVDFPIFEKIDVLGEHQASIYKYLTEETKPSLRGMITWNFEKFLVNKTGNVVARFAPAVPPHDPALIAAIEAALKE